MTNVEINIDSGMNSPEYDNNHIIYRQPQNTWKLIEEKVVQFECEEIKTMLGYRLVEEILDLHQEVDALLEIWRDYRMDITQDKTMLPEPPAVRERLKCEIEFFVNALKDRAEREGCKSTSIGKNSNVIDYVLTNKEYSRPMSARSGGKETPLLSLTPSDKDRMSLSSSISDDFDSINDRLNYLQFDSVVESIRQALIDEKLQLLKDVIFLQNCIDSEIAFKTKANVLKEPTITDLREERSHLEKELLNESRVSSAASISKINLSLNKQNNIRKPAPLETTNIPKPPTKPRSMPQVTREHVIIRTSSRTSKTRFSTSSSPIKQKPDVFKELQINKTSNSIEGSGDDRPTSAQKFRQLVYAERKTDS